MFSSTTEHALRALVQMARLPEGSSILGRQLAAQGRIPANYLSKILVNLRNAGLVKATRGQGGGYRLGRHPKEIGLIEIVSLFEGNQAEPGCLLGGQDACSSLHPCSAHASFKHVREVYMNFLTSTTLAQIATPADEAPQQVPSEVSG